jgi:hypothetical protein
MRVNAPEAKRHVHELIEQQEDRALPPITRALSDDPKSGCRSGNCRQFSQLCALTGLKWYRRCRQGFQLGSLSKPITTVKYGTVTAVATAEPRAHCKIRDLSKEILHYR